MRPSSSPGIDQQTAQQGPTPGTSAAESPQAGPQGAAQVEQPSGAIGTAPFMAPSGNAAGPANIVGTRVAQAAPEAAPAGYTEQTARNLRAAQKATQFKADVAGASPFPGNKELSERLQQTATDLGARAQKVEDFLAERSKQQYGVGIAGQTAAAGEVGKAKGARVGEVIAAGGKPAYDKLNDLNVIEDAVRQGGNNITYGPGAEFWQKAKTVLAGWGIPQKGLAEADSISKMNALLAAAAAKSMTARPSQLEFKTFVANNPGIMNSKEGTIALINILKQTTRHDIELGQVAGQSSPDDWAAREQRYYDENPLQSPFTGKPLTPPRAPNTLRTGADLMQWGTRMGLAPGDQFMSPDGKAKTFMPQAGR